MNNRRSLSDHPGLSADIQSSDEEGGLWEDLPHCLTASTALVARAQSADAGLVRRQAKALARPRRRQAGQGMLSTINFREAQPAYAELPIVRPGSKSAARRYKGPVERAQVLDRASINIVTEYLARRSRSPESDFLKLWLSVRAGMRAGEIADLPITAMLDANGRISDYIEIYASKTKTKRQLPMHPAIHTALQRLLRRYPHATHAAFSVGGNGELRRQAAGSVVNWFYRLYQSCGLIKCSSHSGRRTFATDVAKVLGLHGASLRDLQLALGHASLTSTECYVEPSNGLTSLVRSLGT